MPRISKRRNVVTESKLITIMDRKKYKVAIYTRLSVDSDDKKNESIDTQIAIIEKYISESVDDLQVYDRYRDLGKTGTNFERNEFERMLQDIRLGDVNCVIVKDLSRFARNYVEAGNYIERIFPFLGVRFIAVSDHFDSESKDVNSIRMGMNIKNLVNEMYAKDFSKKAQVQIRQRAEQGIYVGGVIPYGYYTLKGDGKRVLYPEKETANVIKIIFSDFNIHHNINAIGRLLAKKRINTPTVYHKTELVYCPNDIEYKGWATESIKKILKNPIYLGMLVQGKSSCLERKEENRKWFDKSQWIVRENTHEALVDQKTFEEIQQYFKNREEEKVLKEKKHISFSALKENVFHDVIICGQCGRPMQRVHHNERVTNGLHRQEVNAYSCEFAYSFDEDRCKSNRINESKISELLLGVLNKQFLIYLDKKKDYIAYNTELARNRKSQYQKDIDLLMNKSRKVQQEVDNRYQIYREGIIGSDEFMEMRLRKKEQTDKLDIEVKEANQKLLSVDRKMMKQNQAIRDLLNLKASQLLTKDMVNTLVEQIIVYPGKRVDIKLAYTNELLEGGRF